MPERNYLREVEDALRKKREAAERISIARRAEVWDKVPGVRILDEELATTASKVLSAMIAGGDSSKRVAEIRANNEALRKKRSELLVKAGYPADYTQVKYDCEKCADSGYVGIDMCACMKSCIAEMRLSDSDLGRLASTQNFDNFNFSYFKDGEERARIERNYKILRSFAEGFSKDTTMSYLLIGDTGLGKTHLSTAVGVQVIKLGYDVVYKTVQTLIDDFEEVQFKGGRSDSVKQYYDCDLLIIDDLGCEFVTQFTKAELYNIINSRALSSLPTIISTNCSAKELEEKYTQRTASRILGYYYPLAFCGRDVRQIIKRLP